MTESGTPQNELPVSSPAPARAAAKLNPMTLVGVIGGVVVVAAIVVVVFLLASGGGSALKFAHPDSVSVVQIKFDKLSEMILEEAEDTDGVDEDDLEELLEGLDSVTLFTFEDKPVAGTLAVYHTDLEPDDLQELLTDLGRVTGLRLPCPGGDLDGDKEGRYEAEGSDLLLIYGEEADDLADGVVLVGPKDELEDDDFVKELGDDLDDGFKKAVGKAKKSAVVWLATFPDDKDGPVMVYGWADPRDKGSGEITMVFEDEEDAEDAAEESEDALEEMGIEKMFEVEQDDEKLILVIDDDGLEMLRVVVGMGS